MDFTIPMISLAMQARTLDNLPDYALPERYGWRYFQPGDARVWSEIETSAGEFKTPADGMVSFRKYYPTDALLDERMIFLTDDGVPFATATAWYGDEGPKDAQGRLHWVSVDTAHQGQGLSRPLVALAMHRIRELGHRSAFLTTQTASWVAIRVYRDFGFVPLVREAREIEGWRIVSEKTGIDFLRDLKQTEI